MNEPLAYKLRPTKLSDILGQDHLVGEGKIISNFVKNNKIFSMILYGHPGIGKTSIASAIASEMDAHYRMLNAAINNKADVDKVIAEAKMYGGIILIMDEIHRMNKDKQDILLPYIESGLITIIGLTTANPYHSINPAIRSRCQLFELKDLTESDIITGLKRACESEYLKDIVIDDESLSFIAKLSSGDLRFAYNLLEVAYYASNKNVTIDVIKSVNTKKAFLSDKNEDNHYNLLSAFQKSIRGSDVNASLHYLARLIESGDLDSIYRRMTVIAYEDIGLANPIIPVKVDSCIRACERVGLPELTIPLSVMIIEMALSPKSNTAYKALNMAFEDLKKGSIDNIPKHIQITAFGYKYPHDYKGSYVKQQYLPDNLKDTEYFHPKNSSKYEKQIMDIYEKIKKINAS